MIAEWKSAQVLVERAQVERRLAAAIVGAERLLIALPGAIVVAHAVLEQPQVVPRRGIVGIERDDPLVGIDGRLPALRVPVPRRGPRKPDLGGICGGHERPHQTGERRLPALALELTDTEVEEALARAWVEPHPVLLDDDALVLDDESELGQWRLRVGRHAPRPLERFPHPPDGGAALEQTRRHPRRHQLAERSSRPPRRAARRAVEAAGAASA